MPSQNIISLPKTNKQQTNTVKFFIHSSFGENALKFQYPYHLERLSSIHAQIDLFYAVDIKKERCTAFSSIMIYLLAFNWAMGSCRMQSFEIR